MGIQETQGVDGLFVGWRDGKNNSGEEGKPFVGRMDTGGVGMMLRGGFGAQLEAGTQVVKEASFDSLFASRRMHTLEGGARWRRGGNGGGSHRTHQGV